MHTLRHRYFVTAFLLGFICTTSIKAGDWPRFHGPNGTGIASDSKLPVKWTKDNVLWKIKIPGVGKSSPIVSKGKVFLQSSSEDGDHRFVLCIDAKSGDIDWTKKIAGKKAHTHKLNTLASSTGCADDKQVYFAIWDGDGVNIHAFTYKGKEVWKQPLGKFRSQHGPGGSPIVHDNTLVYAFDMDGLATVYALDTTNGKIKWQTSRTPYRASYSAPFLREGKDGKQEVVVTSSAGITGYDLEKGSENWKYVWEHPRPGNVMRTVACSPRADGIIVATSGSGAGNREVIAVDLNEGSPVLAYTMKRDFPYVPSMLAKGKYFYVVHDRGIAACIEAKTGKVIWKERLGSAVSASPVMANDKIYVPGENGSVFVIEPSTKFNLIAKNELDESFGASPAVANDRLYLRGQEYLFCIGKK